MNREAPSGPVAIHGAAQDLAAGQELAIPLPSRPLALAPFTANRASGAVTILDDTLVSPSSRLRREASGPSLPGPHRDPVDRMLIAHALLDRLVLVSNAQPFDTYGITRLWQ